MEDDEELYEDEFFMSRTCKCYGCTKMNCDHRLKQCSKTKCGKCKPFGNCKVDGCTKYTTNYVLSLFEAAIALRSLIKHSSGLEAEIVCVPEWNNKYIRQYRAPCIPDIPDPEDYLDNACILVERDEIISRGN